ncbi:uncharacterized protein [Elaeis guineensis]|uniref:Uncharacterized protein LOC105060155 n=1 Tax=Elaeis guineensis var. tenera TaxID=51953 RepID=A0A6J0PSP0_ELAGV|nr:uncharacterized protein LOC105060155 [Elaeis guineensis]XP_019711284.1 uncharacterized protein LOC105060155 [Elaeis guineensis]XP_019711285.1 uncharacterized protein LOC105060155 [Elaeis guineensis]XP_019711286.1 uncharacterized protein LOC105060155 [Elaeis guineensis]XP_019711287.1 uncharacterized protein LOC105060155 [Elaeis guineensis]XP_019711288.1 uncharacterized protein LOC105060155 [Elaeis guineensis]XP_019711289.1 uncharacterized protein LOC105060155 [Elaeis guineensis]XP_01971129
MEQGDEWLAADKLQHLLACFLITVLVAVLAVRSRHPFLRRRSTALGSLFSLFAGAAKEAGDEIGLWSSAGASVKDAAADLVGILIASLSLALYRRLLSSSSRDLVRDREISMV